MRKLSTLFVAATAMVALAACGRGDPGAPAPAAQPSAPAVRSARPGCAAVDHRQARTDHARAALDERQGRAGRLVTVNGRTASLRADEDQPRRSTDGTACDCRRR